VAPPPAPINHGTYAAAALWKKLDELDRQLQSDRRQSGITAGAVTGMTTTLLSVGYVIWCIRGGSMVATLLTTLPLWRWLDPLPVLDANEEKRRRRSAKDRANDEDEERIRNMID
jgi:hypothetical protein